MQRPDNLEQNKLFIFAKENIPREEKIKNEELGQEIGRAPQKRCSFSLSYFYAIEGSGRSQLCVWALAAPAYPA